MRRRTAFTLIELLVVIAIIALLVSILMPSLQKAKELAKDMVCASNLRTVSYGIALYCEENSDSYPYTSQLPSSWVSPSVDWALRIGRTNHDDLYYMIRNMRDSGDPDYEKLYEIAIEGYVDYNYDGRDQEKPGAFKCPTFIDQVIPKSTWDGACSCQFSINGNLTGSFADYDGADVEITQTSDVRQSAVLLGDGNLNPGGYIRVTTTYRTNNRGELYRKTGWPYDFGPWTWQENLSKWQSGGMHLDFYGHSAERAEFIHTDGGVRSYKKESLDHKDWRID